MTAAGIVVYQPNKDRLLENITRTLGQVDRVFLYCNDAESKVWLEDLIAGGEQGEGTRQDDESGVNRALEFDKSRVKILDSDSENHGVAEAFNRIVEEATRYGMEWCLLLDQDSLIPEGMVQAYENEIAGESNWKIRTAILTCVIRDKRNGVIISEVSDSEVSDSEVRDSKDKDNKQLQTAEGSNKDSDEKRAASNVRFCITSGSYINTAIWKMLGGYREDYFIDLVDQEYCAKVHRAGFEIHLLEEITMDHELGTIPDKKHKTKKSVEANSRENDKEPGNKAPTKKSEATNLNQKSKFQLRDPYVYSAFRRYYITRNRILIAKEYPECPEFGHPYLKAFKRLLGIILYEDHKFKKINATFRGIHDARKMLK